MIRKERLEDIDIMEGIDFKKNKEKVRQEIRIRKIESIVLLGLYVLIIVLIIIITSIV